MAEATIGAGYVKALLELCVSMGADQSTLLSQSTINTDDLADRDCRISVDSYKALMKTGKALLNEPALGVLLGEATVLSEISIVGLIANASKTMLEASRQINRFGRLVVEVEGHRPEGRFDYESRGDEVLIVDTRRNPNSFPELSESAFAMMVCNEVGGFGKPNFAKAVYFTHAEPNDRSQYDRVFNVPVYFSADKNALLIDSAILTKKLRPANRYVFGIFSEHAQELLQSLQKSETVKDEVESLLIPILHTGEISMDVIAKKMGLGRQILYRKLKNENSSYEKLLDGLRHKMALHYLRGKKASVNETAYLVGFSEPSNFSRAFKRWTGHSPGRMAREGG